MLLAASLKGGILAILAFALLLSVVLGRPMNQLPTTSPNAHPSAGTSATAESRQRQPHVQLDIFLDALGEPANQYTPWHYAMLQDEMDRWPMHPAPTLDVQRYLPAPRLPSGTIERIMNTRLLENLHRKTLLYVGSRSFDHGSPRDFYITPISVSPSDPEFQQAQSMYPIPPNVREFLGVESPSMALISTAMRLTSRFVNIGLHGHVPAQAASVTALRSGIEQSLESRSLFDVLTNLRHNEVLPLFPVEHVRA